MINNSIDKRLSAFTLPLLVILLAGAGLYLLMGSTSLLAQPQQVRAPAVETPIGSVVAFAGPIEKIPSNWMVCDGSKLSRTDPRYRSLFLAIGNTWGGDGTTYFYLPDLMGRFLRGVDKDGRGNASATPRDPDRERRTASNPGDAANPGNSGNEVGSLQDDAMQNHKHRDAGHNHAADVKVEHGPIANHEGEEVQSGRGARVNGNEGNNGFLKVNVQVRNLAGTATIGDPTESNAGAPRVGGDTRPNNAFVYWIIRYR